MNAPTACFMFAHKTKGEHGSPLQNNGKFVPLIKFGLTNNRPQDNFICHSGFHRLICSAS